MLYRFGSTLIDTRIGLPSLPAAQRDARSPVVEVVEASGTVFLPEYEWRHHWVHGESVVASMSLIGEDYVLRFPSLADFLLQPAISRIEVRRHDDCDNDTLEHLVADQVLPRWLAHQGKVLAHGCALTVADRGLLVVGETGAGKSTLAGLLAAEGHVLHSDDCVEVEPWGGGRGIVARPTYASLRMLPDSVNAVFPQGVHDSRPMARYSRKRRILPATRSSEVMHACSLHTMYRLSREPSEDISIEPITASEACMALVEQSFLLDPTDLHIAGAHLRRCAGVGKAIPAFAVSHPRDFARADELVAALTTHLARIRPG